MARAAANALNRRSLSPDHVPSSSSLCSVCVVTTSYPSHDGDPAGHFVHAEVLELEAIGHRVTVVTPDAGGAFGWPGAAFRLREKPWRAFESAAWMLRATAQVRAARAEKIIAHWSIPSAFPVVSSAALDHVPLEIVSHGGDVRLLAASPRAVRHHVVRRLMRRATSWRFVSEPLLEKLATSLDATDAKALRAMSTIAPSPLAMIDVKEDARARRNAVGSRPLFVCAGRLIRSKRVDRVIDYVAGKRSGQPILVVIGDGPERERLEKLAREWQIDVRFLGNTPRREALAWIGAADELVHASIAEGISTVVREAEELGVKVTVL